MIDPSKFERSIKERQRSFIVVFVIVSAILCYWNLGKQELHDWDESLYGVNAYEMEQRGDWLNPYYAGKPDEWNVKPPLNAIFIIVSHRIWGYNEWGLRFPSATATFIFLLIFFFFVRHEWGVLKALLTASMLLGCTGLIGIHAGRTADTDSVFNLFLFLGAISIYRYCDVSERKWLFIAAFWLGAAFYTKATAVFLVFPGLIVFLLIRKRFVSLVKDQSAWLAAALFLFFPVSWITAVSFFGADFGAIDFGGSNSWTNSILYDTFQRFSGTGMFEGSDKKHDFIFTFLDSRFNLWHFPFFGTVLFLLWKAVKNRHRLFWQFKMQTHFLSSPFVFPFHLWLFFSCLPM